MLVTITITVTAYMHRKILHVVQGLIMAMCIKVSVANPMQVIGFITAATFMEPAAGDKKHSVCVMFALMQ